MRPSLLRLNSVSTFSVEDQGVIDDGEPTSIFVLVDGLCYEAGPEIVPVFPLTVFQRLKRSVGRDYQDIGRPW